MLLLTFVELMQCIKQRCWYDDDPVSTLPGLRVATKDSRDDVVTLKGLGSMSKGQLFKTAEKLGVCKENSDVRTPASTNEEAKSNLLMWHPIYPQEISNSSKVNQQLLVFLYLTTIIHLMMSLKSIVHISPSPKENHGLPSFTIARNCFTQKSFA